MEVSGIDRLPNSWVAGLDTLMKMITLLKSILEDAPVRAFETKVQPIYITLREKFTEWIMDLGHFVPLRS